MGRTATSTTSSSSTRDGGINGVKIIFEECETGYATDKGVECYERLKGKHGGATAVPAALDRHHLRAHRQGARRQDPADHGRATAAPTSPDGSVFKWNFPLAGHLLGRRRHAHPADRQEGRRPRQAEGQEDRPRVPRQPVRQGADRAAAGALEDATASSCSCCRSTAPGVEQKSTWLQIRQSRPDYVLLWGWGVMNSTAIKEAHGDRLSAREDVRRAGGRAPSPTSRTSAMGAKGYNALAMQHGAEPNSKVVKDILAMVHDKGQGTGPEGRGRLGALHARRDVGHARRRGRARARRSATARARS